MVCTVQFKKMYTNYPIIFFFFFETGVEDSNFAYGLLMELTRAYLAYADNSRAQDSAAYAIQVRVYVDLIGFMLLNSIKKVVNSIL